MRAAAKTRMDFFNTLTDLLSGFKEVKFSKRRSDELQGDIVKVAGRKRVVGRPFLYATTRVFLFRFGVIDLSDLRKIVEMAEAL